MFVCVCEFMHVHAAYACVYRYMLRAHLYVCLYIGVFVCMCEFVGMCAYGLCVWVYAVCNVHLCVSASGLCSCVQMSICEHCVYTGD